MQSSATVGRGGGGSARVPGFSLDNYQLRLPSFEGPLDILLRLIERNQLPIAEISLILVTGQFLDYVATHRVPAATLAEFATTGSRLVLLKSRSLLPRPAVLDDEESADDLVRELIEYQAVKSAAAQLGSLDLAADGAFAHRPEAVASPVPILAPPLARHQPRTLATALRRRLAATVLTPNTLPVRPVVTLRQMAERILDRLGRKPTIAFASVIGPTASRQDVLTAFQAVLALVRRHVIVAEQSDLFEDITIRSQSADPADNGAVYLIEGGT